MTLVLPCELFRPHIARYNLQHLVPICCNLLNRRVALLNSGRPRNPYYENDELLSEHFHRMSRLRFLQVREAKASATTSFITYIQRTRSSKSRDLKKGTSAAADPAVIADPISSFLLPGCPSVSEPTPLPLSL